MAFWRRRTKDEDEAGDVPHYEDPAGVEPPRKDQRRLARLRKEAQKAAGKAAREAERAREAAGRVRAASQATESGSREAAKAPQPDVPTVLAGTDRPKELAKRDERRLARLRRKVRRG